MRLAFMIGFGLTTCLLFTGCKQAETKDYTGTKPELTIQGFFNGKFKSYGLIQDWCNKVQKTYTVEGNGQWKGNEGTLTENYTYSDGDKVKHVWKFKMIDANHFTGTAEDAVGELQGEQYGNAIHLIYTLNVKTSDTQTKEFSFDDWLYRINDHVVLNKVAMKKYGLVLGRFMISHTK